MPLHFVILSMYELMVETCFAAAHRLRGYGGDCENLHGHNWRVAVRLACDSLNDLGMVMDFKEVKALLDDVISRLDHKYLNEVAPFETVNPTTEHMATYIARELTPKLPQEVRVRSVTCWESEKCGASYSPENGEARAE